MKIIYIRPNIPGTGPSYPISVTDDVDKQKAESIIDSIGEIDNDDYDSFLYAVLDAFQKNGIAAELYVPQVSFDVYY